MYIEAKPAVYKIENEQTHECYVGGTRNVAARKRNHLYDLRKGRHRNPKLQEAHNLGNSFSFQILEYLDEDSSDDAIVRREQEWHEFLKPAYNGRNAIPKFGSDLDLQRERKLAGRAHGHKQSQEEKDKRSKSCKEYWETHQRPKMPIEYVEKLKTRMSGAGHHFFGKSLPEEMKNKISDTLAKFEHTLISPTGEVVLVRSLKRFAKDAGVSAIYDLVSGKVESAKGWKFVSKQAVK